MTHRWTHDTPRVRVNGERFERGDEFEPTEHELRCWSDRMEEVEETDEAEEEEAHTPAIETAGGDSEDE